MVYAEKISLHHKACSHLEWPNSMIALQLDIAHIVYELGFRHLVACNGERLVEGRRGPAHDTVLHGCSRQR
jgi:hypothetical protein